MSEDRRPRGERRVGDATQARIKDMADGWKKPAEAPSEAPTTESGRAPRPSPPPPPAAKQPKPQGEAPSRPKTTANTIRRDSVKASQPPGPPKSSVSGTVDSGPTRPPPIPGQLPPLPKSTPARNAKPTPAQSKPSSPPPPPPFAESSAPGISPPIAPPKVRPEGSPLPATAQVRDDDPTIVPSGEEKLVELPELRPPAALARRKGLWGDMIYVGTVIFGRRGIRLDLRETEQEIEAEKRSRDKELTELARLAVADPDISTIEVEEARDELVRLEEARSRKAGAAAAAEQAIGNILRERDKVKESREKEVTELETKIAELEAELVPLEKRRVEIGKRARELTDKLAAFDVSIAEKEKAAEGAALDEAAVMEAALAGLRAEREGIAAKEPLLATELAEVDPAIREFKKQKNELHKAATKLKRAEDESVVRSAEKVTAARAHKTVVDRAAADRTREQNELLRDLGDALWRKPPPAIVSLAAPLEERALNLDRLKERAVVCREKLASVEFGPLLRGAAIWLLIAAAIGAVAYLALWR